jgi:hypothetical protein
MKYKGIELVEVTEPQIFNPPKPMLVWDADEERPVELNVCAIVNRENNRVITERTDWKHCAKIPEIPEVLATNRELARWLAEGKGEVMSCGNVPEVRSSFSYDSTAANEPIAGKFIVRKWDDTEWHVPSREYLGLEDK